LNNAFASEELLLPPGGMRFAVSHSATPEAVAAADHTSRHWEAGDEGVLPVGSDQHKRAACEMFRATFNPYKPSVIA